MLSLAKKTILFLFVCLPIRLQFMKQSLLYPTSILTTYLSYFYLLAGIGIMYLFLFNKRLKSYESGGKTWWHQLRPIFSILWLGFFLSVHTGYRRYSYIFLLIEVMFGLLVFLINFFKSIF